MTTHTHQKSFSLFLTAGAFLLLVPGSLLGQTKATPRLGVMTHFAHGWSPEWIAPTTQAAIKNVRDELYWQSVEPEKGQFRFPENFDRYMAELKKNQVEPLIVLSFENKNYDNGATPYTDAAIEAYARYAVEVLRHYGSQIKAVEIWNEYNGTFCKGPATQNRSGTYLRMLRAAYTAIKRERPDVIVVGGSTSGVPLPYWTALLAGGGLDFMDAISVHPYRYDLTPEGLEQDIADLNNLVKKFNGGATKPIWVTEIGWYTKPSKAPGDLAIDDMTQAKFLVRSFALLLSAGIERVYWYLLYDYEGLNMGLFHNDANRTAKPACTALTNLIQFLRDANFVALESTTDGLYSVLFKRSTGEPIRIVWSTKPKMIDASGSQTVMDFMGNSVDKSSTLKLDDSPLFITGSLKGIPPSSASTRIVLTETNSVRDFSPLQENRGWSYGVFVGDTSTFMPLPTINTTDWTQAWSGPYPHVAVTARDQHPSAQGQTPITAVRRWESTALDSVRISGFFRCGLQGDGVGASIWVDGVRRFRKLLGGKEGTPVVEAFDFILPVKPGTRIDFAVDPGPATDINYDATSVSVSIVSEG